MKVLDKTRKRNYSILKISNKKTASSFSIFPELGGSA